MKADQVFFTEGKSEITLRNKNKIKNIYILFKDFTKWGKIKKNI